MGWFSPVKGSYPSLAQVDKTLPVDKDAAIVRGTIVAMVANGESSEGKFQVATAKDKLLYVSLQDYTDPTAGFAGTAFDQDPDGGVPRITALSLDQDGEYETSVFDGDGFTIGGALYVKDGFLTASGSEGDTVVGYVTALPAKRWVNNAIAVPDQTKLEKATDPRLAVRTGAQLSVLRFRTK